jgi:hypothetical protein
MKREYIIILVLLGFALGVMLGVVVPFGDPPTPLMDAQNSQEEVWFSKYEESGNAEPMLAITRGYTREEALPLLVRANALAASAIIDLQKLSPCPILFQATRRGWDAGGGIALFTAIEPEIHFVAVVLVLEDQQGQLVHYRHPVYPNYGDEAALECALRLHWLPVDREALVAMGELRDGIIYVETTQFPDDHKKIRIPEGEVAVGLQYPDGSYSNFIPLSSYEEDYSREED